MTVQTKHLTWKQILHMHSCSSNNILSKNNKRLNIWEGYLNVRVFLTTMDFLMECSPCFPSPNHSVSISNDSSVATPSSVCVNICSGHNSFCRTVEGLCNACTDQVYGFQLLQYFFKDACENWNLLPGLGHKAELCVVQICCAVGNCVMCTKRQPKSEIISEFWTDQAHY